MASRDVCGGDRYRGSESRGRGGESPEVLILQANEFPRFVSVGLQGERRDRGSSLSAHGYGALCVAVGKFRQVGGETVKGFVDEDGPGSIGEHFETV